MATGNLLLGQASGAVGSLVFARANGQLVTKARQEQVRYSNTLAQAIQRICISTAGQAYRHIQEVCCRSFQGIQPGKATHDEFMKRNVRLLRQSIRRADAQGLTYSDLRYFTPVGFDTLLPNAYIVSSGSLPTISSNIIYNDPTHARLAGVGSSYQDIISFYGLQRGDILTFVFMQPDSSGIVRARSARVVLDPWSPIGGKASLGVPFIAANNKINCPNPDNSGEFAYLVNDSGNIIYSLINSDVPLIAAGVFASRRTATGSWLHSDCQLTVYDDSDIIDKFTLQQAIDVANGTPIAAISPSYLNNAGTSRLPVDKSRLPQGYSLLEYIETDGQCYIDTSILINNTDRFEITFQCANGSLNTPVMGAISGGASYESVNNISLTYVQVSSKTYYAIYCNGRPGNANHAWVGGNADDAKKHTIKYTALNVAPTIDDEPMSQAYPVILTVSSASISTWLFGRNNTASGSLSQAGIRIYEANFDSKGHFVPCRRNSDNEVGMFDLVSWRFFQNSGYSSFIPGPDVK